MGDESPSNIPAKFYFSKKLGKNNIRQLLYPSVNATDAHLGASLEPGKIIQFHGRKILISNSKRQTTPAGADDVLYFTANKTLSWAKNLSVADLKWQEVFERRVAASAAVENKFKFVEEKRNADLSVETPGLRSPQIGAIYAALAHWKMSSELATIVLPTGTGKTDCMVSLMALRRPTCLLVVVPTDALRTQIAAKFMRYGVLVQNGLLPADIPYPVVGMLKSKLESSKEIEVFCQACNVIVTTMPLLSRFSEVDQGLLASFCDSLYIDEAHHVRAETWNKLRGHFAGKPILQFTATPYRNDGKHVDGRIIFNYPLRKAQEDGYFNKLILKEVWDYVEIDESVAKSAVNQLVTDLDKGLDHIIMARAASIQRAEALKTVYDRLAQDFAPVVIHSELKQKELDERLEQLYSRKSRLAICVSMFGEGFDFPELKIAAIHDIHQSLAVTIQFTGRFTRSNPNVGPATIIVNRADDKIDESVRELYAEGGGADWNVILTKLTEGATETQIKKQTFYESFAAQAPPLPIQNITPKMSTVVYRMKQNKWQPFKMTELAMAEQMYGDLSVSLKENTAFFVIANVEPVRWADTIELTEHTYDLYAVFWDSKTNLLYINSSNNDSVHEDLAKAVGGDDVEIISGIQAFKVLSGIKRLLLHNMGLNDRMRRSVRFVMYTGSDIREYLESSKTEGKEKTHVFGDGFDGTARITIGTSKKGRIWSWLEAKDLLEWKKWCVGVGAKLIDTTIEPEAFLQDSLIPTDISKPPALYPMTVEWPDELYHRPEEAVFIGREKSKVPFFEVSIDLVDPQPGGPLKLRVSTEDLSATYELAFGVKRVTYIPEKEDLFIWTGKKQELLSEFFGAAHPLIRYEKDTFSRGDQLLEPRERTQGLFDRDRITAWDWTGIDLQIESQTLQKLQNSVQRRTIEKAMASDWDRAYEIVFDDDAPGECADVVGLAVEKDKLVVDLFHCKFAQPDSGPRVDDLYEVCGQAVRSIKWRDDIDRFLLHLLNREKRRMTKHGVTRFERGSFKQLVTIRGAARSLTPEFRIFIVQPGLSASKATNDQRELLSTTELYLHETRSIKLVVIGKA